MRNRERTHLLLGFLQVLLAEKVAGAAAADTEVVVRRHGRPSVLVQEVV